MKRYRDAGITKDSSQEIEGLLKRGKEYREWALPPSYGPRTSWPARLPWKPCNWIYDPPTHRHFSEHDDMHGSRLHPTCGSLFASHMATDSSRPTSECRCGSERLERKIGLVECARWCFGRRDKDRRCSLERKLASSGESVCSVIGPSRVR